MYDQRPLSLDELKARGEEALRETRRMISDLTAVARDSRRTARTYRRWSVRPRAPVAFAVNAKS